MSSNAYTLYDLTQLARAPDVVSVKDLAINDVLYMYTDKLTNQTMQPKLPAVRQPLNTMTRHQTQHIHEFQLQSESETCLRYRSESKALKNQLNVNHNFPQSSSG